MSLVWRSESQMKRKNMYLCKVEIKMWMMENVFELLEKPYWVVDILPEQVPKDSPGQYFAVERYYLHPERLARLRRGFAEILLRLNCYDDMEVTFDSCESWERNPDPEGFAEHMLRMSGNEFLRAVFPAHEAMIDIEPEDTYMTVYNPTEEVLEIIGSLAGSEGLFVWQPNNI